MQCSKCGAEVPDGASFCGQCGAPVAGEETPNPESAKAFPADPPPADDPSAPAPDPAPSKQPAPSPKDQFEQAVQSDKEQASDEPERTVWEASYAAKAMYGHFLLGLGVSILLAVVLFKFRPFGQALLWWIIASLAIEGFLYGWLLVRKLSVSYELTTQRLIHQRGLLSRTTDRIELIDIDDVTYRQGPIERILDVGTIKITSSDRTHPVLEMPGIERVREISGKIDDLRRAERRRRSLHIEAI